MKSAGRESRRSALMLLVFILLLVGFPFFFYGGPGYHAERSFKEAWNLGHVLFFSLTTWLVIKYVLLGRLREKSWGFFLLVFCSVLVAGIGIELLQGVAGGRSIDKWDLYRNQLGCLTAFALTGSLPLPRKGKWFLRAVVVCLLFFAVWPLYPALSDERLARNQFPLLADFETSYELSRWIDVHQLQRQQEFVRHGKYGVRVQLSTATYSGTYLFYFLHDWRDYRKLHFSVYNPEDEVLALHCRMHDTLHHEQYGGVFADRFHKRFELQPGWNDLSVSLQEVRTSPATRLMDMAQVEGFGLFVVRQQRAHVLYMDYIYLSR